MYPVCLLWCLIRDVLPHQDEHQHLCRMLKGLNQKGLVTELTSLPLSWWMGRSWSSAVLWWSPELLLSPDTGFLLSGS